LIGENFNAIIAMRVGGEFVDPAAVVVGLHSTSMAACCPLVKINRMFHAL